MRKILVTGGAGFVGRHIVRRLLEAGDEVHCVDSIVPGTGGTDPAQGWPLFEPRDYSSNFHFYKEDCRTWFARENQPDSGFDYAFHLAAMVGGRLMIDYNPLAVADDLSIDATYWQWAKTARPSKTICFSSSAAYPTKLQKPGSYVLLREEMITFEDDIGMPDMTYGWAKLTNEYLARIAHLRHGLKTICYRPFSGYGEDQDDTYPFPSICKRAIQERGAKVLNVWGTGTQSRDFIHIEDCVTGILTTMDKIDDADALNLSTGLFTTFIDFAKLAADILGYQPEIRGLTDKPAGTHSRAGDTAKQKQLGFTHTTDFRTGIERALEYYLKQTAKA